MSTRAWLSVMTAFAVGIAIGYTLDVWRSVAWETADWMSGRPGYTVTFGPPPMPPPPLPPDSACILTQVPPSPQAVSPESKP